MTYLVATFFILSFSVVIGLAYGGHLPDPNSSKGRVYYLGKRDEV